MVVYSVFVISKSGGLIYNYDHSQSTSEVEKTFSYPLDLKLDYVDQRIVVTFGQRDGIKGEFLIHHSLTAPCLSMIIERNSNQQSDTQS